MPAPAPALLLAGHGTRSEAGVEAFGLFVERVAKRLAGRGVDVDGGFIELSAPVLHEACAALVGRGARSVVALPLVLVAAGHGKGDIPASLARESERHPGLALSYGRPLWPHAGLLDLLAARIAAATPTWEPASVTVVLVGRGSTDPDANAELVKAARLLWDGRGFADVLPAFISLAEPDVPAALERAARLGAERIVVAPWFLFPGLLPDRVVEQAQQWAAAPGRPPVRVADLLDGALAADPLGSAVCLEAIVEERYDEAIAGDIRMNCDTCLYRVALPGQAHRVGARQVPHEHPDEPGHHHHH